MKTIVSCESICKSYGEGTEKTAVLNGVNLSVTEGEFLAVMGPSGCGKTTLMYALSGMDDIDSGTVCFEGHILADMKEAELADLRRSRMGFIFQQPAMLKNLNLLDNIVLPALHGRVKNPAALTARGKALMAAMGIGGLDDRAITKVSGGQLQRAGICRALIGDPVMIFGDEPTGALNSQTAQEIMALLAGINRSGTALMLVTHDAKVAAHAQRVLFMRDGSMVHEMALAPFTGANLEERTMSVTKVMREHDI